MDCGRPQPTRAVGGAGLVAAAATLGLSSIGTADRMLGHAHDDEYGDAAGNPRWRGTKGVSDGSHELAGEVASPNSG